MKINKKGDVSVSAENWKVIDHGVFVQTKVILNPDM